MQPAPKLSSGPCRSGFTKVQLTLRVASRDAFTAYPTGSPALTASRNQIAAASVYDYLTYEREQLLPCLKKKENEDGIY
jgi:hypothetical protein